MSVAQQNDHDDYEHQQFLFEVNETDNTRGNESGALSSVFDPGFSSSPRSEMYRSWVHPDLFPDEPLPRLENWPVEDLEAFCGIYK